MSSYVNKPNAKYQSPMLPPSSVQNENGFSPKAPPNPPPKKNMAGGIGSLGGVGSSKPLPSYNNPPADKPRQLKLSGHVGFDSLPQQLVDKATENGFVFNILSVGETGIGKSTLMESLFNMPLDFQPCSYELKTVELRSKTYDISESGVRLKLSIVETAGFGDQLDKEMSAQVIKEYIDKQFELYLQEELKIRRCLSLYHDTRIHVCLYFISPTGHGLKAIDVLTMKELSKKVNIIPIIAKADTTSKDELKRFKSKVQPRLSGRRVMSELRANGIALYEFPEDDDTVAQQNKMLNSQIPFAVVGSTDFVDVNGKKVRARNYPWGIVEVENESHCDFVKLREALLRVNVEDLRNRTDRILYERYRNERMKKMGLKDGEAGPGFAEAVDVRMKEHQREMADAEKIMKDRFVARVQEKEKELKQQEEDLRARYAEKMRTLQGEANEIEMEEERITSEIEYITKRITQQSGTLKKGKR